PGRSTCLAPPRSKEDITMFRIAAVALLLFTLFGIPTAFGQCYANGVATSAFDSTLRNCAAGTICDLTQFTGSCQIGPSPLGDHILTIPANAAVKLGVVTITTYDVIKLAVGSSLIGVQSSNGIVDGNSAIGRITGTKVVAATNFFPGAVIELDAGGNLLQDI